MGFMTPRSGSMRSNMVSATSEIQPPMGGFFMLAILQSIPSGIKKPIRRWAGRLAL